MLETTAMYSAVVRDFDLYAQCGKSRKGNLNLDGFQVFFSGHSLFHDCSQLTLHCYIDVDKLHKINTG